MLVDITSSSHKSHVSNPFSLTSSPNLSEPSIDVSTLFLKLILEHSERKHRKKDWELNCVFQDVWVAKLP